MFYFFLQTFNHIDMACNEHGNDHLGFIQPEPVWQQSDTFCYQHNEHNWLSGGFIFFLNCSPKIMSEDSNPFWLGGYTVCNWKHQLVFDVSIILLMVQKSGDHHRKDVQNLCEQWNKLPNSTSACRISEPSTGLLVPADLARFATN